MRTAYHTENVALGALEGDEFHRELVAMHGPFATVANRTQQPLESAAVGTNHARVLALKRKRFAMLNYKRVAE